MPFDPARHHRRSIRYPGYDYSQPGAYFLTFCIQDRRCLLGEISDDEVRLSPAGMMVRERWLALPGKFPVVELDEFVVMPNHFHGILILLDAGWTRTGGS